MSIYVVQPNDTPMSISMKLTGNAARVSELVRANAHKPAVVVPSGFITFQELRVGEHLTVPPSWALMHSGVQSGVGRHKGHVRKPLNPHTVSRLSVSGVGGHAYPQRAPHFDVRPRAGGGGGGDDSGHGVEPILTISGRHGHPAAQPTEGVGQTVAYAKTGKPCCGGCASGGPCDGGGCGTGVGQCVAAECAVQMPPCSGCPKATPSIPGSTSFPVGFGRGLGQAVTTGASTVSTVGDALAGWGVPLAVGAVSIVAGFGLAYVLSNR